VYVIVCVCVCACVLIVYVYVYVCMCMCMCKYKCVYVYVCVCLYVFVSMCMYPHSPPPPLTPYHPYSYPLSHPHTALHHAAAAGAEAAVLLLLRVGAARFARDQGGTTPGAAAKRKGYLDLCALIDADPFTVHIHDASFGGQVRIVRALLRQGCPVGYRDERVGGA